MSRLRIQEAASHRLDEIYRYTRERWGQQQAELYIHGLFEACKGIATHRTPSRPIPAPFGITGYFFRYERHFVYWRRLSNGDIGIVTILHERMHQYCNPEISKHEIAPSLTWRRCQSSQ